MIVIDYGSIENKCGRARTILNDECEEGFVEIKRGSWTLKAEVIDDWYSWANEFVAISETYGIVAGDFEKTVIASSQRSLDDFLKHFPYEEWDYADI